ncbi:hypothetical protein CIPAW_07G162900 [Carya illinoinensis]|uniref:Alpha-glucan water dikinase-like N-terminal Ig-like domain-containing protein n=1 Tax=Carya illinoinensis TaxID=32201 RepID=A0A8T1Q5L9_CARIL|nr:hypothetical protein CIPAW_07G162900 [Carya illinoinensis]
MASSKPTSSSQVPRVHHFELVEGTQLQIDVIGSSSGRNVRIELQLRNCTTTWILHWGCIYRGNTNWFIPADHPSGKKAYKQGALQTPFTKLWCLSCRVEKYIYLSLNCGTPIYMPLNLF